MMWSHEYQKKPPDRFVLAHIRNDTLRRLPALIGCVLALRSVGTAPAMSSARISPPPWVSCASSTPLAMLHDERLSAFWTVKSAAFE